MVVKSLPEPIQLKGKRNKTQSFQKLKEAFEWEWFVLGGCPSQHLVYSWGHQKPLSIFEMTGGFFLTAFNITHLISIYCTDKKSVACSGCLVR